MAVRLPRFNLPVGRMSSATYGTYPGYHNSLDVKDFIGIENLLRSIDGRTFLDRMLFVPGCSDGDHNMADIAEKCGCTLQDLRPAA